MTIPSDTVWEVNGTSGSDTQCGGGFSAANKGATGVDYSTNGAAKYTYTSDLTSSGSTFTSAGSHFTNDILGNVLAVGATYYCVTGFTSSSSITVDRTVSPTVTGGTGYLGGGLGSPGQAGLALALGGAGIYVKQATYNIGNGTINTSGNRLSLPNTKNWIFGYSTNRQPYNNDTRPIWEAQANSQTILSLSDTYQEVGNISFKNTGAFTPLVGVSMGSNYDQFFNLDFTSYTSPITNASGFGGIRIVRCSFTSCGQVIASGNDSAGGMFLECVFVNPTGVAFSLTNGYAIGCIVKGFTTGAAAMTADESSYVFRCSIASGTTGKEAFRATGNHVLMMDCVAYEASGTAFDCSSTSLLNVMFVNCAGNVFGTNVQTAQKTGCITLTGDPFTSVSGNDLSLNNTAGAGAACRGAGVGSFTGLSTTSNPDIGAVQHTATAGGPVSANMTGSFVNG